MGHGFCDNVSKCQTLNSATDDIEIITKAIMNISKTMDIKPEELRGIGIQISRLEKLTTENESKGSLVTFFKKASESLKPTFQSDNASNNSNSLIASNNNISTSTNSEEISKNSIKMFTKPLNEIESSANERKSPVFAAETTWLNNDPKKVNDARTHIKRSPNKKNNSKKGKKLVKNKSVNTLDNFFGQRKSSSRILGPVCLQ